MANEFVFTVDGAQASAATPIGLADAGLREREHLQEWVLAHPQVLGGEVKIMTFEFGRWTSSSGGRERDRLDVLGLDRDGRLVVVELKRDTAPDTVEMQALKYAALVSRFTIEDLVKVHAQFLSHRHGEPVDVDSAAAELEAWADLTEEALRQPRIVLMATAFPKTTTATVVFLHQQLGLEVSLLAFQAYRTDHDVLITVSQHYPPPDVEEFVLSPEVNEVRQQRTARQTRAREASTVARLLDADVLEPGQPLLFRPASSDQETALVDWFAENPQRRSATWQDVPGRALVWDADGQAYSPTGLAQLILEEGAARTGALQGPLFWVTEDGRSLVDLARDLPITSEVPAEVHLGKLTGPLRTAYDSLDSAIRSLGEDVTVASRVKSIKYYRQHKICDVLTHLDHLSVYLRGLDATAPDPTGLVVGGSKRYVHAQVRTTADVERLTPLLQAAYARA